MNAAFAPGSPPTNIGNGRFGLTLVARWNEGEFQMFAVLEREHHEGLESRRNGST